MQKVVPGASQNEPDAAGPRAQDQTLKPREERIHRRLLLVGPGVAAFYLDACRLMALDEPLETTTHLVSHLLREIESALRSVLAPMAIARSSPPTTETGNASKKSKTDEAEKHKRQIKLILMALNIPEDDSVARAWLNLSGSENPYALHSRAHRDGLAGPRRVDANFRQFWDQIQDVLDAVLDRFEARYLDWVKTVQELVGRQSPTAAEAKTLRQQVPNDPKLLRYFAERASPAWLTFLRDEGFFTRVVWPWSVYLARVAQLGERSAQEQVTEILLQDDNDEQYAVALDMATAALALPADLAARLAAKLSAWMSGQSRLGGLLPDQLGALISHLAKGGEHDSALHLARAVLAVVPDPKETGFRTSRGTSDDHHYERVLQEHLPDLLKVTPARCLEMLCDLLRDAVQLSVAGSDPEHVHDFSTIWRHAIEDSAQDLSPSVVQGVRGLLVSSLRDAAERVVGDQLMSAEEVVGLLGNYQWSIFRRTALHVLRLVPSAAPQLVRDRLLDHEQFANPYDSRLLHEYALLLRDQFKHLSSPERTTLLGWIDRGPDPDRVKMRYEENWERPFTAEDAEAYRKRWQQNRLALIRDDLPPDWQLGYQQLVAELGDPEHPEFQSYSSGVQSGPGSPISASELAALAPGELVERIVNFDAAWAPGGGISAPSPAGLAGELRLAVSANPERFVPEIRRVQQLSPAYVYGVISGLDEAARQNRPFDWGPVLELCLWAVNQPRSPSGGPEDDPFDVDRGWRSTRRAVAHLLWTAPGSQNAPAFELRELLWSALLPLTTDPEPDEGYEKRYLEGSGPAHLSINTVRAEALHAVVRYALWVRTHLERSGGAVSGQGFDRMPEVRKVLDAHLDQDAEPSLAVRSVYGQWLPWLHSIDEQWVLANLSRIFPPDDALRRPWTAAWGTYIIFNHPYDSVFPVLSGEYARAIERLADGEMNLERHDRADEHLAEHLVVLYARGHISLDEDGSLIVRLFEQADARVRAHAMETAGRLLRRDDAAIPADVIERLKRLWEWRLNTTRTSSEENRAELSAFWCWFTSRTVDGSWALVQLGTVLRLIGHLEHDYDVPERLVELAVNHPLQTLECLHLMIEGTKDEWRPYQWRDEARRILQIAKQSGDPTVLEAAADVANRLAARGLFDIGDTLS